MGKSKLLRWLKFAPLSREQSDPSRGLGRAQLTYLGLFVLACLPYLNTIPNGFVYDDMEQVLGNPFIVSTHYLKQVFTMPVWAFKNLSTGASYIRPLMSLTYMGLHKIYGDVASGYHIFSIVLAAWIACLVYAVTRRWTHDELLSIAAAVIFAMHPIHSEAVAWIGDITDLEVTFFILLAFWCYLGSETFSPRDWLRRFGGAFFFALALLSKEIAVVLPPVVTVFECFYREDRSITSFRTKMARWGHFWIVLILYFIYRKLVLGSAVTLSARSGYSFAETLASGFQLFTDYLVKLFWPHNLIAFYVFSRPKHLWDFQVICGLLSFVFLVVVAFLVRRSQPLVSFAICWFLAFLALALNVRWLAAAAFAERYLFLPSLGFAWIVAFYFVKLWRRTLAGQFLPKRLVAAAALLVLALCFIRIYVRNRDWHDNEVLYKRTLQLEPNAIFIRINLGDVYWSSGRQDQAIDEWKRAHQESPRLIPPLPLINLGMAAVLNRNWEPAEVYLQEALQLSPKESVALLWLARMREAQGRTAEAEEMLLRAQQFAPYDATFYAELGELYFKQNQLTAAAKEFHVAAQQMNDPLYWDRLGSIYLRLGQLQDAEDAYHAALQANPYFSESDVGLGQVYERRGDKVAAREHYTRGLKDNPNNPIALAGLARLQDVR